jgi:beta-lactamase class A
MVAVDGVPMRLAIRPRAAAAFAAVTLAAAMLTPPASADGCAPTPLSGGFMSTWRSKFGAKDYEIAVFDLESECEYTQGDTTKSLPTASAVKMAIAIAVAEDLTRGKYSYSSVSSDLTSMITVSDNNAADRLWRKTGRGTGLRRLSRHYALGNTYPGHTWGTTKTTAHDQVRLLNRALVKSNSYISKKNRTRVLSLMKRVRADQHWGAGGGLPKGWTSAVKNGWYPTLPGDEPPVGRWRVNTVGVVYDSHGDPQWIMAAFSNTWRSQGKGVKAWNAVSRQLVRRLGP